MIAPLRTYLERAITAGEMTSARFELRGDLWDTNRLRLDLRSSFRVNNNASIWIGADSIFRRTVPIIGVQLKDFARGLVDFPSMRDGRVILLCWELGEGDHIEWWHEVEAGYTGRQPL